MFITVEVDLTSCLEEVRDGRLQLPDFQRGWIWDDDHVQRLLRSLIRGFPIGGIMQMETGGELKLLHRQIDGTSETDRYPNTLLLDGQQRITSLYRCLFTESPVPTKTNRSATSRERYYYIDMAQAVNGTFLDDSYVRAASKTKVLDLGRGDVAIDLADPINEYLNHMFPANQLLDPDAWLRGYGLFWHDNKDSFPYCDHWKFADDFRKIVSDRVRGHRLPVTTVKNVADTDTVCSIFENVNMGAVPLTVFELLTAKLAASGLRLREDWNRLEERLQEFPVLRAVGSYQFLQVVALLVTDERRRKHAGGRRVGCEGRDVLSITADEYGDWIQVAERGLVAAARFLQHLCVVRRSDLAYAAQLVSLGAIYGVLGAGPLGRDAEGRLKRWYWCRLFSESYSGAVNTQIARDVEEVPAYVRECLRSSLIEEANFDPERLLQLKTRGSAAFKGLLALQIRNGCTDWLSGDKIDINRYLNERVDVHHIFPRKWCDDYRSPHSDRPIPSEIRDCAVNKTPLARKTNLFIHRLAPSEYVKRIRNKNSTIDDDISSSLVNVDLLKTDEFNGFFIKRGVALMKMLSSAMGRRLDTGEDTFRDALMQTGLLASDS